MKRGLEAEELPQRYVRLKWVAQHQAGQPPSGGSSQLVLDSFELVRSGSVAEAPNEPGGPSAQACVAAASLLASLLQLQVPSSTVLTAEFPLAPTHPNVLRALTPAMVNA